MKLFVKWSYIEEHSKKDMLIGDLALEVDFYFQIPKSTSKKNKELMNRKVIRHNKKPDLDNCIKLIADALNTIAYKDDNQIVEVRAYKYYSDEPRVEVCIKEVI